ncbi:hypothetical protein DPMN_168692 [Dreissena polymorpha]|uniref:Uncharacterized protein n=1 Tax=Dreissena polymorpha TaxID=45954 RepID=A0A9D4IXG8_DREPO|nr:hypothetical protein DPMN_168692 [Dreissena polymorpha]
MTLIGFVGVILKFTTCAIHDVNFISKTQIGDMSSTDGYRGMMVMESLLRFLLMANVKQDRREQKTDAH